MQENGLITVASGHSAAATIDRLEEALKGKGVTVFARIDHAAGAASVGMALRPTLLLVFGNPKAGTPLMESNQTGGIDLPLKALAWEDVAGKCWLTYNDPQWIAARHALGSDASAAVTALSNALARFAAAATSVG
jgi:uncharacterized protein (DUF302 family)